MGQTDFLEDFAKDLVRKPKPIARSSDPKTSHDAAKEIGPQLIGHQEEDIWPFDHGVARESPSTSPRRSWPSEPRARSPSTSRPLATPTLSDMFSRSVLHYRNLYQFMSMSPRALVVSR